MNKYNVILVIEGIEAPSGYVAENRAIELLKSVEWEHTHLSVVKQTEKTK